MNPDDIRHAKPREAASFLDAGKDVGQSHLRSALANALQQIAILEERVGRIEDPRSRKTQSGDLE